MMKVSRTAAPILILLLLLPIFAASAQTSIIFGGKTGDWTQYELRGLLQTGTGEANDEFARMEFLNVAGANVTVNATIYTSGWTELNTTQTIDLTSENPMQDILLYPWYNARVYIIPAGLGVNDSVYLGQSFGNQTIAAQATESYAGASRTVIETNFTYQGNNYSLLWDKQTGVLAEAIEYIGGGYTDVLLSATSLWNPDITWWIVLWVLVAAAIILGIVTSRRKKSKKSQRTSQTPTTNKT